MEATPSPARTGPHRDALSVALDGATEPSVALAAAVAVFRTLANPNRLTVLRALSESKTVAQLRVECEMPDPGSNLKDLEVVGLVERVARSYPVQWQRVSGSAERLSVLTRLFAP